MSTTVDSVKKQDRLMKLAKTLFDPEIILEDSAVFDKISEKPCVIICNHSVITRKLQLTFCDGPMVRYAFNNENLCSLMGADLMNNPFLNLIVSGCDCIPVSRDAASTDWIHKCRKKLKEGTSVVIFPEGTALKEKDVDTFKPGFALLAGLANVDVLPVAINGDYRLFSKGRLKIRIGTPTKTELGKRTKDDYEREALRFQKIVEQMHRDFDKDTNKTEVCTIN